MQSLSVRRQRSGCSSGAECRLGREGANGDDPCQPDESSGCSSGAEHVADYDVVSGAIPLIRTSLYSFQGWDTTVRTSLVEVRILSDTRSVQALDPCSMGCRLGRTWPPNPSSSVQFAGSLLCPFLLGESGRRGVTAARSNLAIGRRIFYESPRGSDPPVARQLVHSPDKREVKVRFLPGGLWSMSK